MTAWLDPSGLLALAAAACFGTALVATRAGLPHLDAVRGAVASISTTLLAFSLLAPWLAPPWPWPFRALVAFAAVGLFFPVVVTLLTYAANARMGPGVTGALGSTTPVFAVLGSVLFLHEVPRAQSWAGLAVIVLGVAALSRPRRGFPAMVALPALALPLAAAFLRGVAQPVIKSGLAVLPNPFLAGWIGYLVSAAVIWCVVAVRVGRTRRRPSRPGALWFVLVGLTNGAAVLLTYAALNGGAVATVAPIVATTPLFALAIGAVLLREEPLRPTVFLGVGLTVLGVVLILLQ